MKEQFVPYDLALKLEELGFDEDCFMEWYQHETGYAELFKNSTYLPKHIIPAPLWQQAFDWLLPKLSNYNLDQMENTFDLRYYDGKEWSYIIIMKQDKPV